MIFRWLLERFDDQTLSRLGIILILISILGLAAIAILTSYGVILP
jgi:hypothetical protein